MPDRSKTLRVGVASAVPRVLESLGIPPQHVFSLAGLSPADIADEEAVISIAKLGGLAATSARVSNCDHFGLLVGLTGTPASLGLLGFAAANSAKLGAALDLLTSSFVMHDRAGQLHVSKSGELVRFSYTLASRFEGADIVIDGAIAVMCRVMRQLLGESWRPAEVHFQRRPPRDTRPYRDFFRAPTLFNMEFSGLVFPLAELDRPVIGADPRLFRILSGMAAFKELRTAETIARKVQLLVKRRLMLSDDGAVSSDEIAHELGIHRRTLHRRLRAEATTFAELADSVRREIACDLLRQTNIPVTQIAVGLRFSEPGAFTRAFKRWTGETPSDWRDSYRVDRT